jgi:hypothetical protein
MGIAEMMNGLDAIIQGKPIDAPSPIPKIPDQLIGAPGVIQAPVLGTEWMRQASTIVPRIIEGVVNAPTDIANLGQKIGDYFDGTVRDAPTTLDTVTQSMHAPFKSVTDWLVGGETNPSLISGTPPELAASWASLAGLGTLRAPTAVLQTVDKGIKALEVGTSVAARTGEYAAKALEMITPVMVRTPTKAIDAASVAIPVAIGVGLEMAFPLPEKEKLDG